MKIEALVVALSILAAGIAPASRALANGGQAAASQTSGPVTSPKPAQAATPPATAGDEQFPALRADADRLKAAYVQLDAKNMSEVDALLKTKRCQSERAGALLDGVEDAMGLYLVAETKHWEAWSVAEQKRSDEMTRTLASMEEERKRATPGGTNGSAELSTRIDNMKAAISARVLNMRQNTAKIQAFRIDMTSYYEKERHAALEICYVTQSAPR